MTDPQPTAANADLAEAAAELDRQGAEIARLTAALADARGEALRRWPLGRHVRKKSGASWQGTVVGFYSSGLTAEGYAVESEREPGSVQIYPASALEELP